MLKLMQTLVHNFEKTNNPNHASIGDQIFTKDCSILSRFTLTRNEEICQKK